MSIPEVPVNVNISPIVRFWTYIGAAVGLLAATWALDEKWIDKPAFTFIAGLAALAHILAAGKTDLSGQAEMSQFVAALRKELRPPNPPPPAPPAVEGEVVAPAPAKKAVAKRAAKRP